MENKFKIDFQDGGCGGHLGFLIETILSIFDLQVALILPTKFQVNWLFCSGEDVQNRFSRWQPSSILFRKILVIFYQLVTLILPIKFSVQRPFHSGG